MMQETNGAKLARAVGAILSSDTVRQAEFLHPDIEIHEADGLPYSGVYRGYDGCKKLVENIRMVWANLEVTAKFIIGEATGDKFVVMQHMRGHAVRSGQAFETSVLELFFFRDGRIAEIRPYYWDTRALATLNQNSSTSAVASV